MPYGKTVGAASDTPSAFKAYADFLCDGNQDQIEIQQAIDLGRDVYLLNGTYNINNTITIKPNIHLELAQDAKIFIVQDVNGIFIQKNGQLSGGRIIAELAPTYDSSMILFDGIEQYQISAGMNREVTGVNNITLQGKGNYAGGSGIRFVANNPSGMAFAAGLRFQNIQISGFQYGIHIDIPVSSPSGPHFFNSNFVEDIYFEYPEEYAIYAPNAGDGDIAANVFDNIQIQAKPTVTTSIIYLNGHVNMLTNFVIWDWFSALPVVEFGPKGRKNLLVGYFNRQEILDLSSDQLNVVHDVSMQDVGTLANYHNGNVVYS